MWSIKFIGGSQKPHKKKKWEKKQFHDSQKHVIFFEKNNNNSIIARLGTLNELRVMGFFFCFKRVLLFSTVLSLRSAKFNGTNF